MRNLKRALSLAMATVMLMSMTVVGAGALSFNDADDITNVSAATVLEALEIMIGDEAGNFNPDKVVSRAEMAIILCRVVYGTDYEADGFIGLTTFTDIEGHWAEAEIGMAYANGWINGKDAETFDPDATVQAYEAYVMLQRALGYYSSDDETVYALGTYALTLASKTGMSSGISTGAYTGLTRDKVALAVYNTMFDCAKVAYSAWTGIYYACDVRELDDDENPENWEVSITNPNVNIAFGTQGTLAADVHGVTLGTQFDVMGRPVDAVYIDDNTGDDYLATSPIEPDKTFIAGADYEDIDEAGDIEIIADVTATLEVEAVAGNFYMMGVVADADDIAVAFGLEDGAAADGDELAAGVIVEVYDFDDTTRYIAYAYFAAEIDDIEYDEDTEETEIELLDGSFYIDGDVTDTYAEGDIVVVTAGGYGEEQPYIDTIAFAEVFEGEITRTPSTPGYYYIDGTKYELGVEPNAPDGAPTTDNVVEYVLDPNGYVIYMAIASETVTSYDYLYVMSAAATGTFSSALEAEVLFADGTTDIITISEIDGVDVDELLDTGKLSELDGTTNDPNPGDNDIDKLFARYGTCTFSFSEDDGEYELTSISADKPEDGDVAYAYNSTTEHDEMYVYEGYTTVRVGNDGASIDPVKDYFNGELSNVNQHLYFTDDTLFVDEEEAETYVGYENIPGWSVDFADEELIAVYDDEFNVLVLFIIDGTQETDTTAGTYVYVEGASYDRVSDGDGDYNYEYEDMYIDGEQVTLISAGDEIAVYTYNDGVWGAGELAQYGIYEVEFDDDGNVEAFYLLKNNTATQDTEIKAFINETVITVGTSYLAVASNDRFTINSDTVYVYIDEDGDVSEGSTSDIVTGDGSDGKDYTYIHVVYDTDNEVALTVFIQMMECTGGDAIEGYTWNDDYVSNHFGGHGA